MIIESLIVGFAIVTAGAMIKAGLEKIADEARSIAAAHYQIRTELEKSNRGNS